MAPIASKPPPPSTAGSVPAKRSRVLPVIPLPIVQKQAEAKERRLHQQRREAEALRKTQEEAQRKRAADEQRQTDELAAREAADQHKRPEPSSDAAPRTASVLRPPSVSAMSHATPATTQTSDSAPSVSPVVSTLPQPSTIVSADLSAIAAAEDNGVLPAQPAVANGPLPPPNLPYSPNGHVPSDFVFPANQSPRGSAVQHRAGTAHHVANAQLQHPAFHQPHVSSSSITFGTLQNSNNPSPAPPPGHGPLHPPPPAALNGPLYMPYRVPPNEWPVSRPHGPPVAVDANGFVPPDAGFNPSTPGSYHGSQSPDNAVDGAAFGPHGGPFPVPVPNGSLAPRNGDPMAPTLSPAYFAPPPPPLPLGAPPPMPQPFSSTAPPERHGGAGSAPGRVIDFAFVHGLQRYLQHSFDHRQDADCHIVLHFNSRSLLETGTPAASGGGAAAAEPGMADQHEPPAVFEGHRNILSQSLLLGQLLSDDIGSIHPGRYNQPVYVVHLHIQDSYVDGEATEQALRHLYGIPLNPLGPPTPPGAGEFGAMAAARMAAMDRALANFAAGFFFMLPPVETGSVEQAVGLLGWETVERVLAFCLNGALLPNVADDARSGLDAAGLPCARAHFRYGRGRGLALRHLLRHALDFVVAYFPTEFAFDATPVDYASPLSTLSRFPASIPSTMDPSREGGPTTYGDGHHRSSNSGRGGAAAGGSHVGSHGCLPLRTSGSVSLPFAPGSTNGRASGVRSPPIQFGDFAPRDEWTAPAGRSRDAGGAGAYDAAHVVSRILAGVPFACLKYVLANPGLGLSASARAGTGAITVQERIALSRRVVAERERCRRRAVDAVLVGAVLDKGKQLDAVLDRIHKPAPPERHDHPDVDGWDVLAWREACQPETGELTRAWTKPY